MPVVDPSARRAMTFAAQGAQGFVAELGLERTLALVGGVLAVIGTLLPLASLSAGAGQFSMSADLSLLRVGFPGVLVMLLAIFLGGAPVVLAPSRTLAFAGIGLSTIMLANLVVAWFGLTEAHLVVRSIIQSYNQSEAASIPGDAGFGAGMGFYCLLLGFAVLFYAYIRNAASET